MSSLPSSKNQVLRDLRQGSQHQKFTDVKTDWFRLRERVVGTDAEDPGTRKHRFLLIL